MKISNKHNLLNFNLLNFKEEILLAINSLQRSPVYGHDTDFTELLGNVLIVDIAELLFFFFFFTSLQHLFPDLSLITRVILNIDSTTGGIVRNSSGHIVAASTAR